MQISKFFKFVFISVSLCGSLLFPQMANAYPVFAQQAYDNPRLRSALIVQDSHRGERCATSDRSGVGRGAQHGNVEIARVKVRDRPASRLLAEVHEAHVVVVEPLRRCQQPPSGRELARARLERWCRASLVTCVGIDIVSL